MNAALALGGLGFVIAALLSIARLALAKREPSGERTLIDAIDALLPQTQCGQCGYPGCRPYAEALAAGERIDRCPPGGAQAAARLQALLGRGAERIALEEPPALVARIAEEECVGCARCIEACPVDAIAGGPGFLHAVLAEHCTGCELCVAPCPVDCIEMAPAEPAPRARSLGG